jgi:uncharacterized protein (TIGR00661 family)
MCFENVYKHPDRKGRMARIIYGVQGEGLGHAIRSKVVIDSLMKSHDVLIFSSSGAFDYLHKEYGQRVIPIQKTALVYRRSSISVLRTLLKFIREYPRYQESADIISAKVDEFKPDLMITDTEMITARVALKKHIPLISIDNHQMLVQTKMRIKRRNLLSYYAARTVTKFFVPHADYYVIVSFYECPPRSKNVVFAPPPIRHEILKAKQKLGKHFLVYQTSHKYDEVLPMLYQFPGQKFTIYWEDDDRTDGNVTYRKLHGPRFVKDLAESRGVITNGGLTLIGEAIYLNKPIFCMPLENQYEQMNNACAVEQMGFGMRATGFHKEEFARFLGAWTGYRKHLEEYKQKGNHILYARVEEAITAVMK